MLRTPIIRLTDNEPLDAAIMSRLMDVTAMITSQAMPMSCLSHFDDHDGKLATKRGVKLQCWMGYIDVGVHDMGVYTRRYGEWVAHPIHHHCKSQISRYERQPVARSQSYHDEN